MQKKEYQQLEFLGKKYWWHLGRKDIIRRQLKKYFGKRQKLKILNVGCGPGDTIELLEEFGKIKNIDISKTAVRMAKRQGYKNIFLYDGQHIPFKKHSFDLLVALDVLEHIDNDLRALKLWKKYLKVGGYLLITAPAYQWLWSEHDEALHHYRRYTASDFHRMLGLSGYRVVKRTYAIVLFFPVIVGYRLIRSIFNNNNQYKTSYVILPNFINSLFIILLKIEAVILVYTSLPVGTSILFFAQSISRQTRDKFIK